MEAHLDIQPLTGSLGAEIRGVDLARPLADAVLRDLRRAIIEHLVVFFPGQELSPQQQKNFTALFGEICQLPYIRPLDEHPEIIAVLKSPEERGISTFGGTWHSDFTFLERPPSISVLYALEVPPFGGDTLWANMYDAYETLSVGMRGTLDGLCAMHSGHVYGAARPPTHLKTSTSMDISRNNTEADAERAHPVVRLHPESGRRALFINPVYTTRFEEMTEEESAPLLHFLYGRATSPEFTCRFSWTPGAVAVWDNRCTLHLAINDYDGKRRLLHRTTVQGERPRSVAGRASELNATCR